MESHATSWEYIYIKITIKTKLFLSFLTQMMKLKTCTVKNTSAVGQYKLKIYIYIIMLTVILWYTKLIFNIYKK